MGSFSVKKDVIDKLVIEFNKAELAIDKSIQAKMKDVVNVVYRTATAKRPKISWEEQKALGRGMNKTTKGGTRKISYRVSDPNASYGVPVKTGELQISIQREVTEHKGIYKGRIWTDNPYAKYMEFGTSKTRPRSFMRTALAQQNDYIKRRFEQKDV